MKKMLLLCFVLMMYKSYSQEVTLEFTETGILKKFNSKVPIKGVLFAKPSYPISLNKDFPSVLLDTNQKVSFVIKQPDKKSIIPDKLKKMKDNFNDSDFTKSIVFKSVFSNNYDANTFCNSIYSVDTVKSKAFKSKAFIYNENLYFPFKPDISSILYLKDKDGKKIIGTKVGTKDTSYNINEVTSFKIGKQLFDNQIIIKHLAYLKEQKKSYNNDWEQFRPVIDEIAQKYETWGKEIDKEHFFNDKKFNIKTVLYLDSLSSYSTKLNKLFDKVIDDNCDWIKGWLWYTEGEIKLNPFIVTDPSPQISIVDEQISLAEDKIKLLNSYVASNREINEEFKDLEKDLGRLEGGLSILKHQKEELAELKTKYETWINSVKQTNTILYDGVLPVSNKDKITWLQHYDAKNKFEYKNTSNSLPHSIADIDEVVTLVHNVQQGQTVEVKSTEKAVNLEPPLAIELEPFLASFVKAFELIPNVGKVANILRPLLSGLKNQAILPNPLNGKESFYSENNELWNNSINISDTSIIESDYQIVIEEYKKSKEKLNWLLAQTTPITEIEPNKEPLTLNSTKILYPEKDLNLTTTKLIASKGFLAGDEKPIFEKEVKKYERQRFWPMAGIAIIPKTREIAVYDNQTQQFKTDTPISTVEGFVGVKWFVFGKTNIDYKYKSMKLTQLGYGFNRKRGNGLINRCALNIGLGVSHQFMKNYLVGVSIDPTPGIGINIGTNFFLQKSYQLENGVVLNEYERFSKPYFYYGINIDPTIFSKIAKLF